MLIYCTYGCEEDGSYLGLAAVGPWRGGVNVSASCNIHPPAMTEQLSLLQQGRRTFSFEAPVTLGLPFGDGVTPTLLQQEVQRDAESMWNRCRLGGRPYVHQEDDPIHIRLRYAVPGAGASEGDLSTVAPEISLAVVSSNTWQMVKRRIKDKWSDLKAVPDNDIRLHYKSVELRAGRLVDDSLKDGGLDWRSPIEMQYFVVDQATPTGRRARRMWACSWTLGCPAPTN